MTTPADTAAGGRSIAAGSVMEWIDKAGYACAVGWSGAYCVTAYVGNVTHRRPIRPGSLIEVQARIVLTGRTSMHVVVTVSAAEVSTRSYTPGDDLRPGVRREGRRRASDRSAGLGAGIPLRSQARERGEGSHGRARRDQAAHARRGVHRRRPRPAGDAALPGAAGVVNWGGKAHGGTVMRWIDEAAYACAASWARDGDRESEAVAVYSGGIHFFAPVRIGDLAEVEARLIYTSPHSMHLSIRVSTADPRAPARADPHDPVHERVRRARWRRGRAAGAAVGARRPRRTCACTTTPARSSCCGRGSCRSRRRSRSSRSPARRAVGRRLSRRRGGASPGAPRHPDRRSRSRRRRRAPRSPG